MSRVTILSILVFFTLGCSWASRVSYNGRASLGIMKENLVSDDLSSLKDAGIVIGRVVRENETGDFSDYVDRKVIFARTDQVPHGGQVDGTDIRNRRL